MAKAVPVLNASIGAESVNLQAVSPPQTRKPGVALLGDVRLSLSTVSLDFLSPSAVHVTP
jgi:hypothetical protein